MSEHEQILYMQTRIMRMAAERWHTTPAETACVFSQFKLADFIEENFDLYHTEGDEAVYSDIMTLLEKRRDKA